MNKKYLNTWNQYEKKLIKNKAFQKEAEKNNTMVLVAETVIQKRLSLKLSQDQLANKANTSQSAIARLESAQHKPSLKFLEKIAQALNSQLQITFS